MIREIGYNRIVLSFLPEIQSAEVGLKAGFREVR